MRRLSCVALVLAGLSPLAARPARAQSLPSLDTRTFRPSPDPQASLVLEPTSTPGPWAWNGGLWLSYAQNPVTLRYERSGEVALRPVQNQLALDMTANVGLGRRAALGVSVPVVLYQDGTAPLPKEVTAAGSLPPTAMGDLALHGKATVVSNETASGRGGPGVALLGVVTLPTGDAASFVGERSSTVALRALVEYAIPFGTAQASIGYRLRTEHETWPAASVGGVRFGDDVPFTLGIGLRPKGLAALAFLDEGDRQTWELAVRGALPAGPVGPFGSGDPGSASTTPVLLSLSDRVALGHFKDASLLAGVDVGLSSAVGVPAVRGVVALAWAPRDHDKDHDGVLDDVDECPSEPEDKDGLQDQDGCPEDDADDDMVPDKVDACPLVKGVMWNDPRKDGCPAPDTDGDTIADPLDACPAVKGPMTDDPKTNGCPPVVGDKDGDSVKDDVDKCPDKPEDLDGYEDQDGCPDPDNDGDGIPDAQDRCPLEKGVPQHDPARFGCATNDRDHDTFPDDVDMCPDQPEVWNGVNDLDGCPDAGGAALFTEKGDVLVVAAAPRLGAVDAPALDAKGEALLRAIAHAMLTRDLGLVLAVRPIPGAKRDVRAELLRAKLTAFAQWPGGVNVAEWAALSKLPGAATGIVFQWAPRPPAQPPANTTPDGRARPADGPAAPPGAPALPPPVAPPSAAPPGPAPLPDRGEPGPKPKPGTSPR